MFGEIGIGVTEVIVFVAVAVIATGLYVLAKVTKTPLG